MEIILLERVERLGQMGDVVSVKAGYARNYLLPQKKASRATKANLEMFEAGRAQLEAVNLEQRKEAEAVAEKMEGLSVVIIRSASEAGHLYGSVSSRDISTSVSEAGFTVSRNQVLMERPVKMIGIFDYRVRLHAEVIVTVSINVAQSAEEAEAQAERVKRGEAAVVTAAEADAYEAAAQAQANIDAMNAAAAANKAAEDAEVEAENTSEEPSE